MDIRTATSNDFTELYELWRNTPELKVSATEPFMDRDEFKFAITNPNAIFLVAEHEHNIIWFIYVHAKDKDKELKQKYACLVYLVVKQDFRRQWIAQRFYSECEKRLQEIWITNIYTRANSEGNGEIIEFMKKQWFTEGHKYVWMDKKISI